MTELEEFLANGGQIKKIPIGNRLIQINYIPKVNYIIFGKAKKKYPFNVDRVLTNNNENNVAFISRDFRTYLMYHTKSRAFYLSNCRGEKAPITKEFLEYLDNEAEFSLDIPFYKQFNSLLEMYNNSKNNLLVSNNE